MLQVIQQRKTLFEVFQVLLADRVKVGNRLAELHARSIKPPLPANQRDVVCKTLPGSQIFAYRVAESELGPKPSCCLQDPGRPDPEAKRWLPKTLGPEPSCCLQDGSGDGVNPAVADEPDSARRFRAWPNDIASSTRGAGSATSARCRDRPGDTRHQWQVAASGSGYDAAVDTAWPSKWPAQGEIGKEQTAFDKHSNAADPSLQNLRLTTRRCKQVGIEEPSRCGTAWSARFRETLRLKKE